MSVSNRDRHACLITKTHCQPVLAGQPLCSLAPKQRMTSEQLDGGHQGGVPPPREELLCDLAEAAAALRVPLRSALKQAGHQLGIEHKAKSLRTVLETQRAGLQLDCQHAAASRACLRACRDPSLASIIILSTCFLMAMALVCEAATPSAFQP